WELRWQTGPHSGDLVLQTSARCPKPVDEIRILFFGCDISLHSLVWVDVNGVGRPIHAPWNDSTIGDPQGAGSPMGYMHPLVALFQGDSSGFFIEGREPRIGPACVMMRGTGQSANIGMARKFPLLTDSPQMYEIRLRTYQHHWEDAVEPFVRWMQDTGYVPLEKKSPAWVREIKNQAYVAVGNYAGL